MKKHFKKITAMVIIALIALTGISVSAQSTMTIDKKTYIYTGTRKEAKFHTTKGYAYCITPSKTGAAQGTTLTFKKKETDGAILYLLDNTGESDAEYLKTQLALWVYTDNYMPETYKKYDVSNQAKALAKTAANNKNYTGKQPSVKLNASSTNLSETSDGNYYKSGVITVSASNAGNATVSLDGAPSGTKIVDANNNAQTTFANGSKFYVMVPAANVTSAKTFKVNAKVTGNVPTVERYVTSDSKWQDLVVIVEEPKTVTTSVSLSVTPVKRSCEIANGKYYDKSGKVVDKAEYERQCVHKCEYYNNHYYDKDGKITDKTTYSIQCEKHTCEVVGNTYFGKDGRILKSKEEFSIECEKHSCEKVGNTYFGKNGNVVKADQYDLECNEHVCEKIGDKYFGKNGFEVEKSVYEKECFKHTCEKVGDSYFGKDGSEVTYDEYTVQCEKHVCEFINNKYFGSNGTEVSEEEYLNECVHVCEIVDGKYYGQDGKEVTEVAYKDQCEAQIVPVPDTGSDSTNLVLAVLGTILLGIVGVFVHYNKVNA
ncbi:MAG: LPXTG cell wall anchor domain-containing protein [Bacilli bacterium]|nr:LPXTG cell wall anchor domain-containing protein [Bacilli bacterium]